MGFPRCSRRFDSTPVALSFHSCIVSMSLLTDSNRWLVAPLAHETACHRGSPAHLPVAAAVRGWGTAHASAGRHGCIATCVKSPEGGAPVQLPQDLALRRGVGRQVGAVSALPKIITIGFRSIQLIYFFTAGEDEVKCWQIRKGSKAPQVRAHLWPACICASCVTAGKKPRR